MFAVNGAVRGGASALANASAGGPAIALGPETVGRLPINSMPIAQAQGVGSVVSIVKPYAAGAGGAPDDVTVLTPAQTAALFPGGYKVIGVETGIGTNVGGATVTARDATAGGGNAVSGAMSGATVAPAVSGTLAASPTVIASAGLYLRRSDSGVAGEARFRLQPL